MKIRDIQQQLAARGYTPGPIDGVSLAWMAKDRFLAARWPSTVPPDRRPPRPRRPQRLPLLERGLAGDAVPAGAREVQPTQSFTASTRNRL